MFTQLILGQVMLRNGSPRQTLHLFSSVMLSSALLLHLSWGIQPAIATSQQVDRPTLTVNQSTASPAVERDDRFPPSLGRKIRRDLARQLGIPRRSLSIASYSAETWPDGCLGLGGPAELCLASIVEGWRVEVTNGSESWFYRSDARGRTYRMEPQMAEVQLPDEVGDRVLQRAAQDSGRPVAQWQIVNASSETWPDGCLGLGGPAELCSMAMVPGWRVEVTNGQQQWVYRTNETGQVIRREPQNSSAELPSELGDRLLRIAAQSTRTPLTQLQIAAAEPRIWDGCLGIDYGPNTACNEIAISGWRVTIAGNQQQWIYHTNSDGSDIRLNPTTRLSRSWR